jgi:Domain of unknown function (DUF4062)
MSKRKIYISSTFRDLSSIRNKIIQLITNQNVLGNYYDVAYIMENMAIAGNPDTALEQCLEQVDLADVYILIIGSWYGSLTTYNGKEQSYTQHEYDRAKIDTKKRIYILHSTEGFDLSFANEVKILCNEKNVLAEDNSNRIKEFKNNSTRNRSGAIYFSSESNLLDEINKCFVGDIAYYYLKETLSSTVTIEPKLKYKIDRVNENAKLVDGMKNTLIDSINQKNVFKVLTFSKPDDRPEYYCKRIVLEKCGVQNPDYIEPFRSSNYLTSLSRFNTNYNLTQCVDLLKSNDDFNINHQVLELSKAISENRKDFFDLFYFEISEIELASDNKWILFINCFCKNLISHYQNIDIQNRIFIFINVNYKAEDSLARHDLFEIERHINIGCLGKINVADVLLFFKNEVLKISDEDSERELDKLEQYKRLEIGISTIQLENQFTYYGIEKYLF